MAQSDVLKPYIPAQYPQARATQVPTQIDSAAMQRWLTDEVNKLRVDIGLLVQVVKQIDARLIAHSI